MTGGDRERLVAELPKELKELVDADRRTNREVVEAALWREFGGQRMGALERRIEEKQRRVSILESERNERERELEEERQELEALKSKKEAVKNEDTARKEQLYQKVRKVPKDPENMLIQEAAEELDMTPEEIIEEAYE